MSDTGLLTSTVCRPARHELNSRGSSPSSVPAATQKESMSQRTQTHAATRCVQQCVGMDALLIGKQ